MAGRDAKALAMLERLAAENYKQISFVIRAGTPANLGPFREARHWVERALAAYPDTTIESIINGPALHSEE